MMIRATGRGGHVRLLGGPGGILRRDQRRFLSYPYTRKAIRPDDGRGDRDKDRDRNGGGNVVSNDVNTSLNVSGGSTVTCDQPINQAATASGGYYSGYEGMAPLFRRDLLLGRKPPYDGHLTADHVHNDKDNESYRALTLAPRTPVRVTKTVSKSFPLVPTP